jgi:hypothetical protein
MTYNSKQASYTDPSQSVAWVRDALDSDQLTTSKRRIGRLQLTGKTVILLWGLRVYVLLMILLIGCQIWNALHV